MKRLSPATLLPRGRRRGGLALVLMLAVSACSQLPSPLLQPTTRLKPNDLETAQARRNNLEGKWLGVSVTGDGHTIHWIKEHYAEGSYKATFRDYGPNGQTQDQVEVGSWGLSGPVYFTIMRGWVEGQQFRQSNLTRAYYYDAYKILELTPDKLVYQHLDTGQRFTLTKVADDFVLPDSPPPKLEEPAASPETATREETAVNVTQATTKSADKAAAKP